MSHGVVNLYTMGGLSLFVRINFAQKMDDHVVYFKCFNYIC
jgi:hypothetical protein